MSKLPYLKLSASLLLITLALNATTIITFASTCSSGSTGHCGG